MRYLLSALSRRWCWQYSHRGRIVRNKTADIVVGQAAVAVRRAAAVWITKKLSMAGRSSCVACRRCSDSKNIWYCRTQWLCARKTIILGMAGRSGYEACLRCSDNKTYYDWQAAGSVKFSHFSKNNNYRSVWLNAPGRKSRY